jgi:DNA-binding Xre family transcriptional regulator
MKAKNFTDHLQQRLDQGEIKKLKKQAELESESLESLKRGIASVLVKHMQETGIGFNELTRGLGISPAQAAKIKKGEANLTFATVAHIAAFLGKKPQLIFN